jgi:hypothetical protein
MSLFHYIDSNEYKAYNRLVSMQLQKNDSLSRTVTQRLVFLGTEHGICRDDALELIRLCMEEQ